MFLIDATKTYSRKEIQNLCYFFTRLFRGGELRAYKIKPVLFYAVGLLAATKYYTKKRRNEIIFWKTLV
jgi:hypothetical protein